MELECLSGLTAIHLEEEFSRRLIPFRFSFSFGDLLSSDSVKWISFFQESFWIDWIQSRGPDQSLVPELMTLITQHAESTTLLGKC